MIPIENYAVAGKRVTTKEALDDFPTPPWATRALTHLLISPTGKVWEPACGRGYMSQTLAETFGKKNVISTDIEDYNWTGQDALCDWVKIEHADASGFTWMITNPPFKHAEKFAAYAMIRNIPNVAILVRTQFLEGIGRYRNLYSWRPPTVIAQFTERVPMVKGRVDPDASTATAYCWIIWRTARDDRRTQFVWIPPCRRELEREGDYTVP